MLQQMTMKQKLFLCEYELYVYKKRISLAFKQTPSYESCSLKRTEVMTIFSVDGQPKSAVSYDFSTPAPQKLQYI
jgi:hypothetical protein